MCGCEERMEVQRGSDMLGRVMLISEEIKSILPQVKLV